MCFADAADTETTKVVFKGEPIMRTALLSALLMVFCSSSLSAVTADNWSKFVFTDGEARALADFEGHTTAIFAFCKK